MKDITLEHPVTINGATVRTIRLRRPKVADVLAAKKLKGDETEQEMTLIANLAEWNPEDVKELDFADYRKVQEALQDFFG